MKVGVVLRVLREVSIQKRGTPSSYFSEILVLLVISLVFLISLTQTATAQDDFTAVTSPSIINACACNTQSSKITILNTGEIEINYLVRAKAENQDLITFANPQFLLKPAQSKDVFTFIKVPCDTAASFDITTLIQTGFGTEKEIKQTIQPVSCESVSLFVGKQDQVTNACTPVVYKLTLRNSMNYLQVMELSLNLLPQYYRLTHNPVVLAPYETKDVFLYVTLPCEISETTSFTLNAKDQATQRIQTIPLRISVNKGSFTYSLDAGTAITSRNDSDTVSFNYVSTKDTIYSVCENTNTIIPVRLSNTGYLYNGYKITLAPEQSWMLYDPSYFLLLPHQEYITPIYLQPKNDQGNYSVDLISTSYKGELSYKIPLQISVVKCAEDEEHAKAAKRKLIISLMLLLFLLILIILLLLVIYIKKKRSQKLHPIADEYYAKQREEESKLKKQEEKLQAEKAAKKQKKYQDKKRMPAWKVWGIIILVLFIVGLLVLAVFMKNVYMPTVTKLSKNILEQKNLSTVKTVPAVPSLNASKDLFPKKESEKKPIEVYDPKKKYKLNETQLKVLYHEMYEDKPYLFLLDGYFTDPDDDYLVIRHSLVKNLSIFMDGTYVKVTPAPDFTGERRVIFTADDSKGGIIYSPEFIFLVKDVPEFTTKVSENMPGIVISVFVVIILLTIILLIYMKPPRQPIVKKKEKKGIEFDF